MPEAMPDTTQNPLAANSLAIRRAVATQDRLGRRVPTMATQTARESNSGSPSTNSSGGRGSKRLSSSQHSGLFRHRRL